MMNKEIIKILNNIATLLELKGENPFKSRAYRNATEIIKSQNINLQNEVQQGTLGNIQGFGKALVSKITDYVQNGEMEYYNRLKSEIPVSLIELTKLSNLGVKKAKRLYEELGITNIDELEIACKERKLQTLKGFASKTEEMILNSIEHKKASKGRYIQNEVRKEADEILELIKSFDEVVYAEITGDIRRFTETIKEINILVAVNSIPLFESTLKQHYEFNSDNNFLTLINTVNIPIIIELVSKEEFFVRLHNSTGNGEYIKEFNDYVHKNNYKIDTITLNSEEDIYKQINLPYVPPELRENKFAIQKAEEGEIPELICEQDLKGMIHIHSTWSDGRNSIKEMALESKRLGFSYMVICDHSKSAVYANGLSPERVKLQHQEIDKLNEENLGIKILKGIESDILADGSLDYDEEVLQTFDLVVASIHSGFRISKIAMTKRIINALKNPYTTILGHATGRLLTVRPEYELDIKEIIQCAADYGKIIEINANPYRLDLSWQNVIYAKEKGVKIAINPDSHRVNTLSDVFIGVKVARKAWLEAKDVVNCLDFDQFVRYITKN